MIVSANLTPAGPLKGWTDGEIFRALRTGIDHDGHHLIIMGAIPVRNMSDADIQAVIAFLRSQPAVVNETPNPPDQPSFLATVMFGAGMLPTGQAPVAGEIVAPAKGPTADYGQYLVSFVGCRDCHGAELTGKQPGGFGPSGPSLRVVKGWTAEQFLTTLRTGVDPSGHTLSSAMPSTSSPSPAPGIQSPSTRTAIVSGTPSATWMPARTSTPLAEFDRTQTQSALELQSYIETQLATLGMPSATPTPCAAQRCTTPTSTRIPYRSPTPTITRTPVSPSLSLHIIRPGPLSKVASPIVLEANGFTGLNGTFNVTLMGEDGRLLFRQIVRASIVADDYVRIILKINFQIPGVAEAARPVSCACGESTGAHNNN